MAWKLLPVDYKDATWVGLKRYNEISNDDGTVSFLDMTLYTNKEKSFFGAKDANRINEAINTIMSMVENGTDLYTAFQNYFQSQQSAFIKEVDNFKSQYQINLSSFENEQHQLFTNWFNNVKNLLSNDVAGNILNEINTLKEKDIEIKELIDGNTTDILFESIPFQEREPVEKKAGKKYIKKTADGQGTLMAYVDGVFKELDLKTDSSQVSHIKKDGSTTTVYSLLQDILSGNVNFLKIMTDNIKTVTDCLTQTTNTGLYKWYLAKNQPSGAGIMLSLAYDTNNTYRIAITYDSKIYVSLYTSGNTYGSWVEK